MKNDLPSYKEKRELLAEFEDVLALKASTHNDGRYAYMTGYCLSVIDQLITNRFTFNILKESLDRLRKN